MKTQSVSGWQMAVFRKGHGITSVMHRIWCIVRRPVDEHGMPLPDRDECVAVFGGVAPYRSIDVERDWRPS